MTGKLLLMKIRDNTIFKTSFYYNLNILQNHNHIYFTLNNGLVLIYNDVRRFGFFKLYNTTQMNKITLLKKLGLEPFSKTFSIKYFEKFVQNKKKNIKNLLMDQTFVSGLGNIYVNEALFLSKIHPLRQCSNLERKSIKNLIYNIRKVLKISIDQGGSSIKDFKNTYGKSGKRLIKLNNQAKELLDGLDELWDYTKDFVSHKFKKEARRLGIPDIRFHDLRRTFGYNLIKQGRPIYEVSKLLGHSSVTTTERHYAPLLTTEIDDFVL